MNHIESADLTDAILAEFEVRKKGGANVECSDHRPVQHRDGKPPWCRACGLTAGGQVPLSRFTPTPGGDS